MKNEITKPNSVAGFQRQLSITSANNQAITILGSGSKLRLSATCNSVVVSTTGYCGIVDHQSSDFTITVRSGTPIRDVIHVLDGEGQYLPFDPVFVDKGATIGGTIAAGINGPCRLRYGGLRDFLIGCQFIDGRGNVIRAGGKVVKNAAGFDLPKFLVGSAGRFGLLLEATFKVFPRPRFFQTAILEAHSTLGAAELLQRLVSSQLDFDALEISGTNHVVARWSAETENSLAVQTESLTPYIKRNFETLVGEAEKRYWHDIANFSSLGSESVVIKVPIKRIQICDFDSRLQTVQIKRRFSVQGNVAILFLDSHEVITPVDSLLRECRLTGQVVVGQPGPLLIGSAPSMRFLSRIKSALDPNHVFGAIENSLLPGAAE